MKLATSYRGYGRYVLVLAYALLSMLCSACSAQHASACSAQHAMHCMLLAACWGLVLHACFMLHACFLLANAMRNSQHIKQPASSQQASSQQLVSGQVASTSNSIPAAGACERSPAMRNTQHIKQPATACLALAVNHQQAGSKPESSWQKAYLSRQSHPAI